MAHHFSGILSLQCTDTQGDSWVLNDSRSMQMLALLLISPGGRSPQQEASPQQGGATVQGVTALQHFALRMLSRTCDRSLVVGHADHQRMDAGRPEAAVHHSGPEVGHTGAAARL